MKDIYIWGIDSNGTYRPVRVTASGGISAGGVARQTNPTAVADAADIGASFDDVGRILIRPHQVRDLITTAQATLSTGTIATLLSAGGAGVFHDLLHVSLANNSTVAAEVALVDDGSIVKTLRVPASSTLIVNFETPHKQSAANSVWQIDMEDITGTTIQVSALFSKEV